MPHLGEIISLIVALSWTVTALFADKASHRLGSMTTNVIRLVLASVFLGVILIHTMFIVAPKAGAAITGDSMIGEYFRVFASYGVVTISLIMYETKKRKNKSLVGQQLAQAQKEEAQSNG